MFFILFYPAAVSQITKEYNVYILYNAFIKKLNNEKLEKNNNKTTKTSKSI